MLFRSVPVQFSAVSQMPAEARQTVDVPERVSAGQVALAPVQFSAGSQMPAEARQTVLVPDRVLPGQAALVPVQFSAGSQMPAEERHTVAVDWNAHPAVQHELLAAAGSHTSRLKFVSTVPSPQVEV